MLPGAPRTPSNWAFGRAWSPMQEMFWLPNRSSYAAAAADPEEWKKFRGEYLETDEAGYQRAVQ